MEISKNISDEIILSLKGIDLFPEKTAKAKEILQKAKIPNRIKSTIKFIKMVIA